MSTTTAPVHGSATWDIDTVHSSIGFSLRHLVISKVQGRFDRWTGSLVFDETHPERSQAEAHIEAASINTHDSQRDAHLRSPDFFDAEKYPALTYRSTRIEKTEGDCYQLAGDLTIAGVTRAVLLDVEFLGRARDPWGGERVGFSAKTTIDRRDFGLVWNQALEAGAMVVGEKVEIHVEIEAIQRTSSPSSATANENGKHS